MPWPTSWPPRRLRPRPDLTGIGLWTGAEERLDEVHRQGKDNRGLLAPELEQSLQVAELKGGGVAGAKSPAQDLWQMSLVPLSRQWQNPNGYPDA